MSVRDGTARPLHSWSAASLAVASAAIEPTWRRWCGRWGVAEPKVLAMNACDAALPPASAGGAWLGLREVEAWIHVEPTATDWSRSLLFDAESPAMTVAAGDGGSIADEVAAEAWRDLRRCLTSHLSPASNEPALVDEASDPPPGDATRWSGAMVLRLACAGRWPTASLHLSFTSASRLVGGTHVAGRLPASAGRSLRPVLEAIGDHRVRITVELDEIVLDFAALGSLRRGDVLALPHPLDRALRVRAALGEADEPSRYICSAVLGAREGSRAVELIRKASTD